VTALETIIPYRPLLSNPTPKAAFAALVEWNTWRSLLPEGSPDQAWERSRERLM